MNSRNIRVCLILLLSISALLVNQTQGLKLLHLIGGTTNGLFSPKTSRLEYPKDKQKTALLNCINSLYLMYFNATYKLNNDLNDAEDVYSDTVGAKDKLEKSNFLIDSLKTL